MVALFRSESVASSAGLYSFLRGDYRCSFRVCTKDLSIVIRVLFTCSILDLCWTSLLPCISLSPLPSFMSGSARSSLLQIRVSYYTTTRLHQVPCQIEIAVANSALLTIWSGACFSYHETKCYFSQCTSFESREMMKNTPTTSTTRQLKGDKTDIVCCGVGHVRRGIVSFPGVSV